MADENGWDSEDLVEEVAEAIVELVPDEDIEDFIEELTYVDQGEEHDS
jgi:hypothetical protein